MRRLLHTNHKPINIGQMCVTRIQFTYVYSICVVFHLSFCRFVCQRSAKVQFIAYIYRWLIKIQLKWLFLPSSSRLITSNQSTEKPLAAKGWPAKYGQAVGGHESKCFHSIRKACKLCVRFGRLLFAFCRIPGIALPCSLLIVFAYIHSVIWYVVFVDLFWFKSISWLRLIELMTNARKSERQRLALEFQSIVTSMPESRSLQL